MRNGITIGIQVRTLGQRLHPATMTITERGYDPEDRALDAVQHLIDCLAEDWYDRGVVPITTIENDCRQIVLANINSYFA